MGADVAAIGTIARGWANFMRVSTAELKDFVRLTGKNGVLAILFF